MVFVNKISKIIQVVTGFIDSIVAIAGGAIGAAATRVESILAGLLSLAISFLAGFVGLGKVADKIMGVIDKVRAPIDKALDWLIDWIVKMAKTLFAKVFGKDKDEARRANRRAEAGGSERWSRGRRSRLMKADGATPDRVKSKLGPIKNQYRLTVLELRSDGETEFHLHGEVNPPKGRVEVQPRGRSATTCSRTSRRGRPVPNVRANPITFR